MRGIIVGCVVAFLLAVVPANAFRRSVRPDDVSAKIHDAKMLMADEMYDDALKMLKQVVAEHPKNPRAEIALATINHIYQIINYMNEAYDYFVAVEQANTNTSIGFVAVYLYIPILVKREQYEAALKKCNEVYTADPQSYWAIGSLFNMANLYCRSLNKKDEGVAIYRKIIKEYPNSQFASIARMEMGMYQK
jgi:tetratricopeptide (TPR) repeat protein